MLFELHCANGTSEREKRKQANKGNSQAQDRFRFIVFSLSLFILYIYYLVQIAIAHSIPIWLELKSEFGSAQLDACEALVHFFHYNQKNRNKSSGFFLVDSTEAHKFELILSNQDYLRKKVFRL